MEGQKKEQIKIPEGCFEGYCGGCFWGKRRITDLDGRILCKGKCGGYHYEHEGRDCQHYEGRIVTWLKILGFAYLMVTFVCVIMGW